MLCCGSAALSSEPTVSPVNGATFSSVLLLCTRFSQLKAEPEREKMDYSLVLPSHLLVISLLSLMLSVVLHVLRV